MKKNLLLLFLRLLSLPTLAQYTIYVRDNVSGAGTSWANSCGKTQLQQAINECSQHTTAKMGTQDSDVSGCNPISCGIRRKRQKMECGGAG